MESCILSFDEAIDKAGGGNDSDRAQGDIRYICGQSCAYQNVSPLRRDWMSYDPNCYPRCIFGLNVASGKLEQDPSLVGKGVKAFQSLTPEQKREFIKSFDDATGMKLDRLPLQNITPEELQDLRKHLEENYKPYSPFYSDNKTKRSNVLMWLIVLFVVGVIIYLLSK